VAPAASCQTTARNCVRDIILVSRALRERGRKGMPIAPRSRCLQRFAHPLRCDLSFIVVDDAPGV
jgi:hypothetical protein